MQKETGITIPSVAEEKQINARGSFFEQAEDKYAENIFISNGEKKLQKINKQVQKDYEREKEDDFLEKSEHIMRVDQFMKNDLKLEEDKQKHQKVVEQYRDSLIRNWLAIFI